MNGHETVRWPVGSRVQIDVGRMEATVVEVIPTYRILPTGGRMVAEEEQIKDGFRP